MIDRQWSNGASREAHEGKYARGVQSEQSPTLVASSRLAMTTAGRWRAAKRNTPPRVHSAAELLEGARYEAGENDNGSLLRAGNVDG